MNDEAEEYIISLESLIEEKPEIKSDLEEILKVDEQQDGWGFQDINVDSGAFGEIVSRGIVEKSQESYRIPHPELFKRVIRDNLSIAGGSTEQNPTTDSIINRSLELNTILLAIFLSAGLFLRIYQLGAAPFWIDESISLSAAMGFLESGDFVLSGSGNPYNRARLSTVIIAASVAVLGMTEFAARLPSVLFGTLTIGAVYLLGRDIESKSVGILSAGLYTFAFFEIAWARQARMYIVFSCLFVVVMLLWSRFLLSDSKNRRRLYGVGSAGVVVAMSQTHSSWIIILPILLLGTAVSYVPQNRNYALARWPVFAAVIAYAFVIITTPLQIFPDWMYAAFGVNASKIGYLGEVPGFFVSHYPVILCFAILGTGTSIAIQERKRASVLIGLWLSIFITSFFSLAIHPFFWPRYLLFIDPLLFITASLGIYDGIVWLSAKSDQFTLDDSSFEFSVKVAAMAVVVASAILLLPGFGVSASELSSIHEPQPDYRQAAQYMEKNNYDDEDVVISTRPNLLYVYDINVDYVVSPHGNTNFDYYTGAEKLSRQSGVKNVVKQNQSGWIVINEYRETPGRDWIEENLQLAVKIEPYPRFDAGTYQLSAAPEEGDEVVYIYRWEKAQS